MEHGNINPNLETSGEEVIEKPELETSEIELVNKFKQGKYCEIPIEDLEWAYQKSLVYYLLRVFPYNYEITEIPEDRPRDKFLVEWIMRETLAMNDILPDMPLRSYKENGLSYTFDESRLSKELLDSFPPPIAVARSMRK